MTNKQETFPKPESIDQKIFAQLETIMAPFVQDIPENEKFKKNIDSVEEHKPEWHQFGIITHTKKFAEAFKNQTKNYLQEWGFEDQVNQVLQEKIDDKTKEELILISIAFHDLGKIARGYKDNNGQRVPDYAGHEAKSEELLLNNPELQKLLRSYALTDAQIKYIARCAGLHFELGKIRKAAKKTALKYTLAFTESPEFVQESKNIAAEYPDYKTEIGLLFLCDNLAKTDLTITANSDTEIEAQTTVIKEEIKRRGLHPDLLAAAKQNPINIAVAREYFEIIYS